MIRVRLERRGETPAWMHVVLPILAVLLALLICSVLVAMAGAPVLDAYSYLFLSTFQTLYDVQDTLVKASPLIWTGLAVAVAFRAKFWNIGAEGDRDGQAGPDQRRGLHQSVLHIVERLKRAQEKIRIGIEHRRPRQRHQDAAQHQRQNHRQDRQHHMHPGWRLAAAFQPDADHGRSSTPAINRPTRSTVAWAIGRSAMTRPA